MEYKYVSCSSLLKTITKKDKLFKGDYTLDPYQNCEYGCRYCDSASANTIYIKSNAKELLLKELHKKSRGIIILGSVHDPYQNIEKSLKLTRDILTIIQKNHFPCHILTKSPLILRDIDILTTFKSCAVTVSITSFKPKVINTFEKHVPSPRLRMQLLTILKKHDIHTGIAFIPILPYLVEDEFEEIISSTTEYGGEYFLSKFLELKGEQKRIFLRFLCAIDSNLDKQYSKLYKKHYYPHSSYVKKQRTIIGNLCKKYKLPQNCKAFN